jgi:hypothetical protein
LQYAVRAADNAAFLFGINYCRHNTMPAAANVQFSVRLKNETVLFPASGITLPDSSVFTWPVNFRLDGGVLLKYATVQPLCHLGSTWVFVQDVPTVAPELCFDAALISRIEAGSGPVQQQSGRYTITVEKPGLEKTITIHGKDGSRQTIVVLSAQEAKQAWLLQEGNQKRFIVSAANMYMADSTLTVFSTQPEMSLQVLNGESSLPSPFVKGAAQGLFTTYRYRVAAAKPVAFYQARKALDNAQWLRSNSVEKTDRKNSLFHRFFRKELSLDNPAAIRSATLVIGAQQFCQVQVNNRWVNQPVVAGQMTTLDLTGYIVKGKNNIMLAFPFTGGQQAFAARVIIEYGNADRIEFLTDSSWVVKDGYNYPSYLTKVEGFKAPEQAAEIPALNKPLPDRREYTVRLSGVSTLPVSNSYLRMAYDGDKTRLYYKSRLVADDFNNGTLWTTGLTNYTDTLSKADLQLELLPLQPGAAVYFDNMAARQTAATPVLHTIQVVPEYTITVKF